MLQRARSREFNFALILLHGLTNKNINFFYYYIIIRCLINNKVY